MSALQELRALLSGGTPVTTGVVMRVQGTTITLATNKGAKLITGNTIEGVIINDRLLLQDGVVIGKVAQAANLPVYNL